MCKCKWCNRIVLIDDVFCDVYCEDAYRDVYGCSCAYQEDCPVEGHNSEKDQQGFQVNQGELKEANIRYWLKSLNILIYRDTHEEMIYDEETGEYWECPF